MTQVIRVSFRGRWWA